MGESTSTTGSWLQAADNIARMAAARCPELVMAIPKQVPRGVSPWL